MRISDWSSDVCSSDLLPKRCSQGLAGNLREQPRRHIGLPRDGTLIEDVAALVGEVVAAAGRHRHFRTDEATEREADAVPPRAVILRVCRASENRSRHQQTTLDQVLLLEDRKSGV